MVTLMNNMFYLFDLLDLCSTLFDLLDLRPSSTPPFSSGVTIGGLGSFWDLSGTLD